MPSMSAGIMAGGALVGQGISAFGANSAAQTQADALQQGQMIQQQNLAAQTQRFQPWIKAGTKAVNTLGGSGPLGASTLASEFTPSSAFMQDVTKPWNPTMGQLESTPGYQFTMDQGLKTVANAYSGQGLGSGVYQGGLNPKAAPGTAGSSPSGAEMKGALQYAQGLASTTYQQQFQNYMTQNAQRYNLMAGGAGAAYNIMSGVAGMGEQATAALGGIAQNSTNQITGLGSAAGAATASGQSGVANALGSGISSAGSIPMQMQLVNALGGNSGSGSLFGGSSDVYSQLGGTGNFLGLGSQGMAMAG